MAKNPHAGSSFDDFLTEEGLLEETTSVAIKRVLARQIEHEMEINALTKTAMAKRMNTSRSQLNRLLDHENTGVSLETIQRAAEIVGKRVRLDLVEQPRFEINKGT